MPSAYVISFILLFGRVGIFDAYYIYSTVLVRVLLLVGLLFLLLLVLILCCCIVRAVCVPGCSLIETLGRY